MSPFGTFEAPASCRILNGAAMLRRPLSP